MVTLAAENLTKIYRGQSEAVCAVNNVSFELFAGEVAALVGPSGTGKTTLLSILGCILRPDSGQLRICGEEVVWNESVLPIYRRRFFGFIAQRSTLLTSLDVRANVAVPLKLARLSKGAIARRAEECLSLVGLEHRADYPISVLSGGELQRVAIARAIAAEPPILLADEPTANLDSRSGSKIIGILRQLATECDKTVLIVTHDERLLTYTDRVFNMEDGLVTESERTAT